MTARNLVASGAFGYLLEDRVRDVDDCVETMTRVAHGGSTLDPGVVARLVAANQVSDPLRS